MWPVTFAFRGGFAVMEKTALYRIVEDNSQNDLDAVLLSSGTEIKSYVEIEGNRTTHVKLYLSRIEHEYVTIRLCKEISFSYSGQDTKGEESYIDYNLGYDSIIGLSYSANLESNEEPEETEE